MRLLAGFILMISIVIRTSLAFSMGISYGIVASKETIAGITYGSWTYHKPLNINTTWMGANVSTTQSNFPICVHINASSWPTDAEVNHFFDATNSNGKRVRFYASDKTTVLPYEVEYYSDTDNPDTSEAVYWVKVGTITGSDANDNVVYIAYGNDPNGTNQDNSTGVWDTNFKMVQHLGDNSWGTAPEAKDSTSNGNNGTNTGTTDETSGKTRKGRAFDGSSQYIYTGNSPNLTGNVTVSLWVKANNPDRQAVSYPLSIATNYNGFNVTLGGTYSDSQYPGHAIAVYNGTGTASSVANTFNNTNDNGIWRFITVTYNSGGSPKTLAFKDGIAQSMYSDNVAGNIPSQTTVDIGRRADNMWYFLGSVDEVRISNTTRSADWIRLEYYSMQKTNYNGDNGAAAATITWDAEE
jgi:hypothetical protein